MDDMNIEDTLMDNLLRSCDLEELDSSLWNDKCDYMELDHCTNLNPNNYNLMVLQLNIRSLLAHQSELKQLIRTTEHKNSCIDLILLCETFLSKHTSIMVDIPGFTHIGQHQKLKREEECLYWFEMVFPISADQI